MVEHDAPCIYVLAGANGAGKSSIAGAMILTHGARYFNPDEVASRIRSASPRLSRTEANSQAWNSGRRLLERAIAERMSFAIETTLGGNTIPDLLLSALSVGIEVRVWYAGLNGVDLHIARVRARVAKGGHAIPEEKIRARYDRSRLNLIRLMPGLTELLVYDNSREADPDAGEPPEPSLVLHVTRGRIEWACALEAVPEWAKPIYAAAVRIDGRRPPVRRTRRPRPQ